MNTFPTFAGLTWDIKKRVQFRTAAEEAESGATYRTSRWTLPMYEFDLTFNWLPQADRDTLEAFFVQQLGPGISFLLNVTNDNTLSSALCTPTANGTNKVFQIPLPAQTNVVATTSVTDNGVAAGANTVAANGVITFTTAPVSGHVVRWSGTYAYVVQFKDDELEFNQMFNQGYEQQGITFRTVR